NAHRDRQELSDALDNAQRALLIQKSLVPINESSVATTLAALANIHYDLGDTSQALDLDMEALQVFERLLSPNAPTLAAVL
ncbi:unnamed protein product, partial [Rotaria magnacalcarata]